MKRIIFPILILPALLSAQPTLERTVIATAGEQHSSGTSFTFGEGVPLIGQSSSAQLTATFQQGAAVMDSVWPGDANDDFVADNVDLLAIGLAYGASGPTRTNASNAWQAQAAPAWLQGLPSGVNYQHPDCNGDGLINDDDTLAISLNYGLIHQKNGEKDSAGVPFLLTFDADTLQAGQTVTMTITLGTDSLPVENGYGLAFRLELDTTLVLVEETKVLFEDSWLGDAQQDLLTLRQAFTVDDRIHLAMTRRDHVAQNGYGPVASVIIMIDDLSGKTSISETLLASIVDPVLISADGSDIPVTASGDEIVITDESTRIPDQFAKEIRLYPNPTSGRAELDLSWIGAKQVRILDLHGRLVQTLVPTSPVVPLDLSQMPVGTYLVEAHTDKGIWREKVTRQF